MGVCLDSLDGWKSRWVMSDWKRSEGKAGYFKHAAGKWHGDPDDKGLMQLIVSLLTIEKGILEACIRTGIFFYQERSKMLMQKSLQTGILENILMTQMPLNLRDMIQFQKKFQIQKPTSLLTEMKMRVVYGELQRYQIQHIKDHGDARESRTLTIKGNGRFLGLIIQVLPGFPIIAEAQANSNGIGEIMVCVMHPDHTNHRSHCCYGCLLFRLSSMSPYFKMMVIIQGVSEDVDNQRCLSSRDPLQNGHVSEFDQVWLLKSDGSCYTQSDIDEVRAKWAQQVLMFKV